MKLQETPLDAIAAEALRIIKSNPLYGEVTKHQVVRGRVIFGVDISFEGDTHDTSFDNLSERYIMPAACRMANEIEYMAMDEFVDPRQAKDHGFDDGVDWTARPNALAEQDGMSLLAYIEPVTRMLRLEICAMAWRDS